MKQVFYRDRHKIKKLLPSVLVALSLLIISNTALAGYKPPSKPSRPKTATGSNSTRTDGCTGNAKTSLTALAPLAHVGQTISPQPTFAWFVPEAKSRDIEFSLYKYTANGKSKLLHRENLSSTPGIMKLSLIPEKASLSVGGNYWWQVALLCNPNRPSEDLLIRAKINVVVAPLSLKNALSGVKDSRKLADIYAENELWYDAFAKTLENKANEASTLSLLADLSKFEAEYASETAVKSIQRELQEQSVRLQQIVDAQN
jgi:hypothetical protein